MSEINAVGVVLPGSVSPKLYLPSASTTLAVVYGTDGPDYLSATGLYATLIGGAGDDTYAVYNLSVALNEQPGGGIDTMLAYFGRVLLPANVENMSVLCSGAIALGNALDNIIVGGDGPQTLCGGAGNDVISGGAGADLFIVRQGEGNDVLKDFQPGIDHIQLKGYALYGFADLQAAMTRSGTDTVIDLGDGEKLVLRNLAPTNLSAGDFLLPADPSHPGMHISFADEFDSFSGSATGIGTTWKTSYGINTIYRTISSNHEAEDDSDSSVGVSPFSVQGGILDITAAPGSNPLGLAYNSGAITTAKSFAQQYGYFEVRAQLPAGQGFWPAFWMLPTNGSWPPEIDIFEVLGNDPKTLYASYHSSVLPTLVNTVSLLDNMSQGFHTYGFDWKADTLRWYFDGALIAQTATPADMRQPMYMLLNLGVGDTGSWPGKYAASMPTAHMLIDYVHVWQTGPDTSGADWVHGPQDVAAFGGTYSAWPDGTRDVYDFGKAAQPVQFDATDLTTAFAHSFGGSAGADRVVAGASILYGGLGAGDDTFYVSTGGGRIYGLAGNDTYVFAAGQFKGIAILDFKADLNDGGEHDRLVFRDFSPSAKLVYVSGSGNTQNYDVVDGTTTSAVFTLLVTNTTAHLTAADYVFV